MQMQAFQRFHFTYNLVVTATAQTLTYKAITNNGSSVQSAMVVRVVNIGNQPVFMLDEPPAGTSTVTVNNGMPILPNSERCFTIKANSNLQFIAPDIGSTVYVTLGEGQ
jgi:hypothetical protein